MLLEPIMQTPPPAADDDALLGQVRDVADALQGSGQTLATAESCTGGWIAKCLTDLAGSSAWFAGGLVTYGNAAKQTLLGVQAEALTQYGAVSETVARQMAEGACRALGTTHAVAVTGIAGPDGGRPDKPVGTVWLAWAGGGRETQAECLHFAGDRQAVRRQTVAAALAGLRRNLTR